MIADALTAYTNALEQLGLEMPEPPEPPTAEIIAQVSGWYGSELPADLLAVHTELGPECCFPDGRLLPLPGSIRVAFQDGTFMAATPVPATKHLPVFLLGVEEAFMFTVALDDAHFGEVWRFNVGPDSVAVRVAMSLEALFRDWVNLISEEVLIADGQGGLGLTLDPANADMNKLNIVACGVGITGGDFFESRLRECGGGVASQAEYDAARVAVEQRIAELNGSIGT